LPTIRNSVWFLCNLCRGKPSVALESINEAFPLLNELLRTETDHDILNDTCWSLSYISDGSNERIQAVLDNFDLANLTKLLSRDDLVSPVLRVIGNIVTGDDVQTQTILNLDVLKDLLKLLDHNKESIVKETCWTVSNITAGTKFQIQVYNSEKAVFNGC
jgi:importin subunit alpha-1